MPSNVNYKLIQFGEGAFFYIKKQKNLFKKNMHLGITMRKEDFFLKKKEDAIANVIMKEGKPSILRLLS